MREEQNKENVKLFYTPPSQEIFDAVQQKAVALWNEIGTEPSYIEEKTSIVNGLRNESSNFMAIFQMFSANNQATLLARLSSAEREAIRIRLVSGGFIQM